MADTLPNESLTAGTWIDLYDLTGIAIGTKISIQNIGTNTLFLSTSLAQPTDSTSRREIKPNEVFENNSGDSGLWAFSVAIKGLINVAIAGEGLSPAKGIEARDIQRTSFGEASVAEPTPVVQILASYGLTEKVAIIENATGTTSSANSLFTAESGADPLGLGSINTRKQLAYKPGEGALCRITALFSVGVASSLQAAGLINSEDGFAFGYLGIDYGIIFSRNGAVEAQELTLTVAAAGAETATVEINGTNFNVPITAGTIEHNAFELAESLTSQVSNYLITSNEKTVFIMAQIPGPNTTFSYSSTGASTGTFAQISAGVDPLISLIKQVDWNRNKAAWINPQKGNVYSISIQYLGFGNIRFFVEDPLTGMPILVHVIEYANVNIIPSVGNPTFRIGWLARNLGNTSNLIVSGGSAAGFVEGKVINDALPLSDDNSTATGAVNTTQLNIITLRNRFHFGGRINRAAIDPLLLSLGTDSLKGMIFKLTVNANFGGDLNFKYIDKDNSTAEIAKDLVTVTGGRPAGSFYVSNNGLVLSSSDFKTTILPDDLLTLSAAVVQTPASLASAGINWQENT